MLKVGDRVKILSKSIGRNIRDTDYNKGEIRKISKNIPMIASKGTIYHVLGDGIADTTGATDWFLKQDLEKIPSSTEEISNAFDDMIMDL